MNRSSKPVAMLVVLFSFAMLVILMAFTNRHKHKKTTKDKACCIKPIEKACVFRTLIGAEKFDTSKVHVNSKLIDASIKSGVNWLVNAQQHNGGWGAGSHQRQDVKDPHSVQCDPASTALSAMALLRSHEKPFQSQYSNNLDKAIEYLLNAVNTSSPQETNITTLTHTQPQSKLGKNIDVILTAQFFTNVLHYLNNDAALKKRIESALEKCVAKIQKGQDVDGGWKDGGWAPVLQSALANNALESARDAGANVDDKALERSREYQKKNYDVKTNSATTGKAAGVMLYSISSTARASAKEARAAKEKIDKAKKEGKLKDKAEVTEENLVIAGYTPAEAQKYATAYKIRGAASVRAQDGDVISGFGSNGGEEFLSYLMTGESLIIGGGNEWKTWYEKMSGRLVQIQNNGGSWSGHHCITSPVFCTATCLLILSIDKDLDFLIKLK